MFKIKGDYYPPSGCQIYDTMPQTESLMLDSKVELKRTTPPVSVKVSAMRSQ